MPNVLVTGGAGFIGSNFVRSTLETRPGWRITVLDALTYAGRRDNVDPRARFVEGDIRDSALVDRLVAETDLIVHFAAESHNDRSLADPGVFVSTNIRGTVTLLEAASRHGVRFHHVSTDEVYGDLGPNDPRFTPDSPYRPSSPYSASKAAADHFVRAWVRSFGLSATISNCSNNYGPRQHPEKFIPRQIINLLRGEPARVYGSGRNVRDWIHVEDHNDAVWTIIERGKPGRTYLIGADGEAENNEVARILAGIVGRGEVIRVRDRPGHDRRYAIDPASTRALGWRPRHTDLRRGLAETVEWYARHEDWWAEAFAASETAYRAVEEEDDTAARGGPSATGGGGGRPAG